MMLGLLMVLFPQRPTSGDVHGDGRGNISRSYSTPKITHPADLILRILTCSPAPTTLDPSPDTLPTFQLIEAFASKSSSRNSLQAPVEEEGSCSGEFRLPIDSPTSPSASTLGIRPCRTAVPTVSPQPPFPGKPCTYSEVIKSNTYRIGSAACPSLSSASRRRKIRFLVPSTEFHRDDAPTTLPGRPSPLVGTLRKASRPILKVSASQVNGSCEKSQISAADPCLRSSLGAFPSPGCRKLEDESYQWQQVKRKYWWRKHRSPHHHSAHPSCRSPSALFLEKTRGRCFNCLARDHRKISCRDPPRCWLCKKSGHLSSHCRARVLHPPPRPGA
jgi:hypothetical protein